MPFNNGKQASNGPFGEFASFDPNWIRNSAKCVKKRQKSVVTVYRTDCVLVRSYVPKGVDVGGLDRGNIGKVPSRASLNRLIFLLNNADNPFKSMVTLTMTPECHRSHSVDQHKAALKAALQKMRYDAFGEYCWVREFQENGSVHWHVFTTKNVESSGKVNVELSREWCKWFATYYKRLNLKASCFKKMAYGNGSDFIGCTRVEQLETTAAGLYASKEGGKRYQKKPPVKWHRGGAWWRASRSVKCTPLDVREVAPDVLKSTTVRVNDQEFEVAFKMQFSLGLKLHSGFVGSSCPSEPISNHARE